MNHLLYRSLIVSITKDFAQVVSRAETTERATNILENVRVLELPEQDVKQVTPLFTETAVASQSHIHRRKSVATKSCLI